MDATQLKMKQFSPNSGSLCNPIVVLHEFYLSSRSRSVDMMHKGTERNANKLGFGIFNGIQEGNRTKLSYLYR
jgi:hypothetical protein